jgi:serine/threonine protein kinase
MFILWLVGLLSTCGAIRGDGEPFAEVCAAALRAGTQELFAIHDYVLSVGQPQLSDRTREAIQRMRSNLSHRCPNERRNINRSIDDGVVQSVMSKRILASEWMGANCRHMGFDFSVMRQLNGRDHAKTKLSVVREATNRIPGEYVMKSFLYVKHFLTEYNFFQFNAHHYLVRPICWLESGDSLTVNDASIVMEKVEAAIQDVKQQDEWTSEKSVTEAATLGSGDFFYHYAKQAQSLEHILQVVSYLAAKLLLVLVHVHANQYVHGDLKPENILVVKEGTTLSIRLLDYDLSSRLPVVRANAGTRHTMAPEVIGAVPGRLTEASEWWSYGLTIAWWMAKALRGWYEARGMSQEADVWRRWQPQSWSDVRGEFKLDTGDTSKHLPETVRCFLRSLIVDDPELRRYDNKQAILSLMHDPFFNHVDWSQIISDSMAIPVLSVKSPMNMVTTREFESDLNDNLEESK